MFFVGNDQTSGLPKKEDTGPAAQTKEQDKQCPEEDSHLSDTNAIGSSPTPLQYMRCPKTIVA